MKRLILNIDAAKIHNADLLLFQRRGVISGYGRGRYSHAAMAGWWNGVLMCVESREFHGARAVTLASQARRFPGRIDVFRPFPFESHLLGGSLDKASPLTHKARHAAFEAAIAKLGNRYSYASILKCFANHCPFVRLSREPYSPDCKPDIHNQAEHCSQFYASSWRLGAGIDPVPDLADWATEPSDLRRSFRCEKVGTISG